jgi:hypothetical protein
MEKISPLLLYSAAIDLQKVHLIVGEVKKNNLEELVSANDCEVVANLMDSIQAELMKLNCVVAAKCAGTARQLMAVDALTCGNLIENVSDVDKIIRLEVETTYAFSLSHAEAAFFDPVSPLLGPDVATKFDSCAFDIEEAGKCHALGRSTGAVFHAFRVLEVGIKALAKCLDVQNLDKPKMRNWGFVLDEIKKAIEAKWPSDKDRDEGDGKLFWEVYSFMLALRVPRNGTMHPARKYTEQEADRMLRIIGDIMTSLAARLDEKGEPKA